jgi:ATP-dependent Clp protease, protease subunit
LPNSRVLVHQPSAAYRGQAADIERHAQDILAMKDRLNRIYAKHTGQDVKMVEEALDRDTFLTADDARRFGIVDAVVETRAAPEVPGN